MEITGIGNFSLTPMTPSSPGLFSGRLIGRHQHRTKKLSIQKVRSGTDAVVLSPIAFLTARANIGLAPGNPSPESWCGDTFGRRPVQIWLCT